MFFGKKIYDIDLTSFPDYVYAVHALLRELINFDPFDQAHMIFL